MKKITYKDIDELKEIINKFGYEDYNCNIVTLLMWKDVYELYFEVHEHFFVGYWLYHGKKRWMMPLCDDQYLKEALDYMIEYSRLHAFDFVIEAVVEPFVDKIKKYGDHRFIFRLEENAGDYVYDVNMHATLKGKKMQKRRNHYNAFIKEYGDRYEYRLYDSSQKQEVLSFLRSWMSSHDHLEDLKLEYNGIEEMLEYYDELNLMGGCVYIDDKIEAFTLASRLSDKTVQIHVEKANRDIRGLYVALFKSFLNTHVGYQFVNREDDLGIPELRKAKMDLQPLYRLRKFAVGFDTTKVEKAKPIHMDRIKALWKDSFRDETDISTDFFFSNLFNIEDTYVIECHQQILAMIQSRPLCIRVGDKDVNTHFIVGVATKKEFRKNGLMRRLMNQVLKDTQEDEVVILQAYQWEIYEPFGFSKKYFQYQYDINQPFNNVMSKAFSKTKDAKKMLEAYHQFCLLHTGYRVRDINYYTHYLLPYYDVENIQCYSNEEGYLSYYIEENVVHSVECTINNVDTLKSLVNDLLLTYDGVSLKVSALYDLSMEPKIIPNMAIKYNNPSIESEFNDVTLFINEVY